MLSINFSSHKNYAPLPPGYRARPSVADNAPVFKPPVHKYPAQLIDVLKGNASPMRKAKFALYRELHKSAWLKRFSLTQDLENFQNDAWWPDMNDRNLTAIQQIKSQIKTLLVFKKLENWQASVKNLMNSFRP